MLLAREKGKILYLRKDCLWGSWIVGDLQHSNAPARSLHSQVQTARSKQMFSRCCPDLNQLLPFSESRNIREDHSSSPATTEQCECQSLKTWNLEVYDECLDETMSQGHRSRFGQTVSSVLEHKDTPGFLG